MEENSKDVSPWDHPEIQALFIELLNTLVDESDRGAVLVGCSYVDIHLEKLFETIAPSEMSKRERKNLLKQGALSSLAYRTEVAYATRLINRIVYDSIHILRCIRNELAHQPKSFKLSNQAEQIHKMYALGDGVPVVVNHLAIKVMMHIKLGHLMDLRAPDEEQPYFGTPEEAIDFISKDPKIIGLLEEQLPRYELAVGVSLLCALIVSHREAASALLGSDSTLSSLHRRSQGN